MAAEPVKKEAAPKVQPIKPRKRGKLPWIVLAVAVIALGGAGTWLALRSSAHPAAATANGEAPQVAAAARAAPIYYKFDPAFVVNFGGAGSARYLQVSVEAMSRDAAILETLKNNEPAVRNDLILLYSSQDDATLMTTDGKEKLRAATLAAVQKVLNEAGGDGKLIEQVYFTSFVIQ
ncbi:MAG TPA: flagellar basal body-associated FliL family protein [Steroidobacteraceae bacterium]|jgi:flagellar FliL protein|nr:flagellar basal body-associated FliL family protein [Steroidobacteraceae bacterium]